MNKLVTGALFSTRIAEEQRAFKAQRAAELKHSQPKEKAGLMHDRSSDGDPYECHCECHSDHPGIMIEHCGPCCEMSPCGLRIVTGAKQLHINQCERCRTIGEQAMP